ncbi:MAG: WYL domain-containing protein [Clostridia bacterium]|nr:WYL domain-containing protein [Clostridia bacterium]
MAYRELIKNFEKIRSYMRDFYIYGFKSRGSYTEKSLRSYDDEKRRIESWLGDYMSFRWTESGKTVFLSVDSRQPRGNPLFRAWKSKSFTDSDITLHFIISDIFYDCSAAYSCGELLQIIEADYLSRFDNLTYFDQSTLRKKLKEYVGCGILSERKSGNKILYSRTKDPYICLDYSMLSFFSEIAPCGVIGSFILDKLPAEQQVFTFKHHYITQTLDSEILLALLQCISKKGMAEIEIDGRRSKHPNVLRIVPIKIFISVQNGRQYVIAYTGGFVLQSYRIDRIKSVKFCGEIENHEKYLSDFAIKRRHMWGASVRTGKVEHIEFTVNTEDGEEYIYRRLMREKRIGEVHRLGKNKYVFSADVYDSTEMIPWIRTFICRIEDIKADNYAVVRSIKQDFNAMYDMYCGGGDDIQ